MMITSKKLINLNPKKLGSDNQSNLNKTLVLATVGSISALVIIFMGLLTFNFVVEKDISKIEEEIAYYEPVIEENKTLKAQNDAMTSFIDKVQGVKEDKAIMSLVLTNFSEYLPRDITINDLQVTGSGQICEISLNGETKNYGLIAKLLANLQMSDEFKNTTIANINSYEKTEVIGTEKVPVTVEDTDEDGNIVEITEYEDKEITTTYTAYTFSMKIEGVSSNGKEE